MIFICDLFTISRASVINFEIRWKLLCFLPCGSHFVCNMAFSIGRTFPRIKLEQRKQCDFRKRQISSFKGIADNSMQNKMCIRIEVERRRICLPSDKSGVLFSSLLGSSFRFSSLEMLHHTVILHSLWKKETAHTHSVYGGRQADACDAITRTKQNLQDNKNITDFKWIWYICLSLFVSACVVSFALFPMKFPWWRICRLASSLPGFVTAREGHFISFYSSAITALPSVLLFSFFRSFPLSFSSPTRCCSDSHRHRHSCSKCSRSRTMLSAHEPSWKNKLEDYLDIYLCTETYRWIYKQ